MSSRSQDCIREHYQRHREEICNECGRSVKAGSGRFVNRIPDCNTQEERKEMGKPYPEGDFVCAECDRLGGEKNDGDKNRGKGV